MASRRKKPEKESKPAKTRPGHNGGGKIKEGGQPGNPYFRRLREIRDEIDSTVGTGPTVMLLRRLFFAAMKKDDWIAARLYLEYVIGKPMAAPKPTDLYPLSPIQIPRIDSQDAAEEAIRRLQDAGQQGLDPEIFVMLWRTIEAQMVAAQGKLIERALEDMRRDETIAIPASVDPVLDRDGDVK